MQINNDFLKKVQALAAELIVNCKIATVHLIRKEIKYDWNSFCHKKIMEVKLINLKKKKLVV